MGRMAATARLRGWRPVNKAVRWAAFAPVPPLILVASLLPDNGLVYGVLAPIAVICLVGWLLAGIVMLTAWRRDLLAVGGEPVQTAPARWSAATRARLAWVGVGVLYGVVLPGVLAAAAIPGYAPVGRAIATAVATYLFFWLLGIGLLLVAHPGPGRSRRRGPPASCDRDQYDDRTTRSTIRHPTYHDRLTGAATADPASRFRALRQRAAGPQRGRFAPPCADLAGRVTHQPVRIRHASTGASTPRAPGP